MNLSLRGLLIAMVSLVVVTTSVLLGTLLLRDRLASLSNELAQKGGYLAQTLAAQAEHGVLFNDQQLLDTLLGGLSHDPDVIWVHVEDEEGRRITAFSESNLTQAQVNSPRPKELMSSKDVILRWYSAADDNLLYVESEITSQETSAYFEDVALGGKGLGKTVTIGKVRMILSSERVENEVRRAGTLVANVTAFVILVGLLLAFALSTIFVKPVKSVVAATLRVSSGEREVHVPEATTPELLQLTQAFNTMARSLDDRDAKLRDNAASLQTQAGLLGAQKKALEVANRSLEIINHELRLRESQLQDSNNELLHASKLKSQFLASMSHELRTPLNSIIGYTECMLDGLDGPINEEQKESLERVQRNGRHLLGLITDILDMSRIEAGQLHLQYTQISPVEIAEECVAMVRPLARDKTLLLSVDAEPGISGFYIDGGRFRQILINLLSNALKFTETGTIVVELSQDLDGLYLSVVDTGDGIEVAQQQEVFLEFKQLGAQDGRGTGLGLAITKRLVEAMQGTIQVSSQVAVGSRFTVWLPHAKEPRLETAEGV